MNDHLLEINRSLHALDDAHRLGRISREGYRARRRLLLEGLRESEGITAGNTPVAQTKPHGPVVPPRRRWLDWRRWFSSRT